MSYSSLHPCDSSHELNDFRPHHGTRSAEYLQASPNPSEVSTQTRYTSNPFLSAEEKTAPGRSKQAKTRFRNSWLWEILSIVTSVACMACIIAVLMVYNGRTAPSLPSGVTLNAVVSLLSTISKAAMLVAVASCISQLKWYWYSQPRRLVDFDAYDESSRGPWGSLMFLFRRSIAPLATMGAIITVIAVGIDPFMQQIITYPTRHIEVGLSRVARAQVLDMKIGRSSFAGGVQTGPSFGMKAAIYRGLFTPESPSEVDPTCPTGNCTIPVFDSLAVCSKCRNVTDATKMVDMRKGINHNNNYPGSGVLNMTYQFPGAYNMTVTSYHVAPSDDQLTYGPAMVCNPDMPENMSRSQLGIPNPFISLALLQFPEVDAAGYDGTYSNQTPRAWQCALYFCLNTYTIAVENSVPIINITSWQSENGTPLPKIESQNDLGDTATAIFQRPSDSPVKGGNGTFSVKGDSLAAMAQYLNMTLRGQQLTEFSEVGYESDDSYLSGVMQALNVTEDIGALMKGLATSVTTYIRQAGARGTPEEEYASGSALKSETYVHVRWVWITLPVSLVLGSALLLLVTMVKAARDAVPVWKTSALAALFHGLEADGTKGSAEPKPSAVNGVGGLSDMKTVADKLTVKLKRKEEGDWSLVVLDR